jgi:hypothetical protein
MQIHAGVFYEFHINRVVSRAGQPTMLKQNVEIGPMISKEEAANQARNGKDVYTYRKSDAEKLAAHLYAADPVQDNPHGSTYFPHFHPGGQHPEDAFERGGRPRSRVGPGHIFFGSRGEYFNS